MSKSKGLMMMNTHQKSTTSKVLIGLVKTILSVLFVVVVGYVVTIFEADGEVAEAQADITDFFGGPRDSTDEFVKSLDRLGHDYPQTYDLNGNTIHFSVNYLDHPPVDVLRIYQREFQRAGLNERMYTDLSEEQADERHLAALTGGIVPTAISDHRVVMGGMITRENPQNFEDLLRVYSPGQTERDLFTGHRYVEAFREPDTHQTTVISTWSDEGFDYGKMFPSDYNVRDFGVDENVPACPGCVRINRFSDLNAHPSPYESNIFSTSFSRDQIIVFYRRAMESRGWELTEEASGLDRVLWLAYDEAHPENLRFQKEDMVLTILVNEDPGQTTYVKTMMTRDRPDQDVTE